MPVRLRARSSLDSNSRGLSQLWLHVYLSVARLYVVRMRVFQYKLLLADGCLASLPAYLPDDCLPACLLASFEHEYYKHKHTSFNSSNRADSFTCIRPIVNHTRCDTEANL